MSLHRHKLLYIAPQNPYPSTDGGKIGIYYPVKNLSKHFELHFVFLEKEEAKAVVSTKHFEELGVNAYFVNRQTIGKLVDIKFLMLNFGDSLPFKWRKYYSKEVQSHINSITVNNNIRLILVSSPHMMKYAVELKKIKPDVIIFFREHNVEYALVEQFIDFVKNPVIRRIVKWQLDKSKTKEVDYWKIADRIFFISDYDYNLAASLVPEIRDKSRVLYDGFEAKQSDIQSVNNSDFIYTANLRTIQNDLSFRWFIEKIWIPNLNFFKKRNVYINVTGNDIGLLKNKLKRFGSLESLNIRNLSFVEDIDSEIRKYKYVLSPTIIGSGIRLKILNGMACGKPVFATPLDLKTCNVFRDMENIVCFEDAKSFVDKFQKLELEQDMYYNICQNALDTVIKHFSWERYADVIYKEFNELLKDRELYFYK